MVYGKILSNAVFKARIGEVPTGFLLCESEGIWSVAIDFVGGHVDERSLGAGSSGCFQEIKRPNGICIEIIKWNSSRPVVAGLGRSMNDSIGLKLFNEIEHALPISDIELIMAEGGNGFQQTIFVPERIPLLPEEDCPLVVVNTMNFTSLPGEEKSDLRSNKAGRTSNEYFFQQVFRKC